LKAKSKFLSTLTRNALLPFRVVLRSQQISLAIYTHGLAGTLAALGFEFGKRGLHWAKVGSFSSTPLDSVFGRNLAGLFIQLGPTFVKLGQVLATRPDIIGEPVAEELRILFDKVPPLAFKHWKRALEKELGANAVRKAFKKIESQALASASLAQTHRAELRDGTPVIVKLQKPGVAKLVRVDLQLLDGLVASIHAIYPRSGLRFMFDEFKNATLQEIDYRREAKNIDKFRKNYSRLFSQPDVIFPRYYPDFLTERVLVLEPMQGKKLSDLRPGSTVARQAASQTLATILEQIFDHGFFHADPHAGNIFFIEEQGKVGCIDLGLVGQLEPEDKRKFLKLLLAVLQRDRQTLAKRLFELGNLGKGADLKAFEKDVNLWIDRVGASGVGNIRLESALNELLQIARMNAVHVPNRYVMMMRSCLVVDGVARNLDPNINVVQVATPIVAKSLMKTASPLQWIRRALK
jgi:ubiquinone biosynthesis protein